MKTLDDRKVAEILASLRSAVQEAHAVREALDDVAAESNVSAGIYAEGSKQLRNLLYDLGHIAEQLGQKVEIVLRPDVDQEHAEVAN
jgi:hypothetical protein